MQHLGRAVEQHDHSATKGLAVARVAAGAITSASVTALSIITTLIADLAVTTVKLADLSVTTAKLAAGAVTSAKITSPLTGITLSAPVFTGIADVQDLLSESLGAAVASAASITLGSDGNNFSITGTAVITTVASKPSGTVVRLFFASTAEVREGGNLDLAAPFIGRPNAVLVLLCYDGANWLEVARAGDTTLGCQLRMTANQALAVSGTEAALVWTSADYNYGAIWVTGANGARITPGVAGRGKLDVIVPFAQNDLGDRRIRLFKDGAFYQYLDSGQADQTWDHVLSASCYDSHTAATYYDVRGTQNRGGTLDVLGGGSGALFAYEFKGPL